MRLDVLIGKMEKTRRKDKTLKVVVNILGSYLPTKPLVFELCRLIQVNYPSHLEQFKSINLGVLEQSSSKRALKSLNNE